MADSEAGVGGRPGSLHCVLQVYQKTMLDVGDILNAGGGWIELNATRAHWPTTASAAKWTAVVNVTSPNATAVSVAAGNATIAQNATWFMDAWWRLPEEQKRWEGFTHTYTHEQRIINVLMVRAPFCMP